MWRQQEEYYLSDIGRIVLLSLFFATKKKRQDTTVSGSQYDLSGKNAK